MLLRILGIFVLTISAVINDFKNYKISNYLVLTGLVASILFLFGEFINDLNYMDYIISGVSAFVIFYLCYLVHAIGAGDAKLLTVIGLMSGIKLGLTILVHMMIIAVIICVVVLVRDKDKRKVWQTYGSDVMTQLHVFHFSVVIMISVVTAGIQYVWMNYF